MDYGTEDSGFANYLEQGALCYTTRQGLTQFDPD